MDTVRNASGREPEKPHIVNSLNWFSSSSLWNAEFDRLEELSSRLASRELYKSFSISSCIMSLAHVAVNTTA